jgi:cellulose synthase/poly-beta-1,6-N-acetylglucosamine synthase-like glycosyltransferase
MVCITVGPETRWESLEASMLGVLKNSTAFADHYGEFMLQQLVLVVVLDGKKAVKPEVFAGLSRAGFLSTDVLEPVSLEPILHCFYTRAIYTHAHHQYGPCQVLVVVKEEQAGRLDSHSIFLAGLCMRIYPEYVFLIEAGVIPNPRALLEMYTALQRDELLGGCCGEVELIPSFCNPVIMAQMFVAKMGHALSLAGFSLLGFMPSLSPAFSAYRFAALVDAGADTDEAPLQRYLAGLKRMERSAFAAFLLSADERILCVEICARTDSRFRLRYVSRAVGTAEAAHDVPSLLGHRKLAVNGSLAGLAYALLHLRRLGCGGGGLVRHLAGVTYVACLLTAVLVHFFAAGILYALYEVFIIEPLGTDSWQFGIANGLGQAFSLILQYTLLFSLLLQIVFGIGNSHATGLKDFYDGSVLYFVLLQSALGLFLGVYFLGSANHFLQLTAAIAVAVVHVAVLLHRPADLLHFAAAAPAFLQLLPLFAIVIPCRSFANLCDSSGGSRIVPASQWDSSGAQTLRSVFMLVWVTANIAMAVALTQLCTVMANGKDVFLMALALSAAVCGAILTGCLVAMKIADCFGRLSVVKATATAEAPPTGSGPPGRPASSPSLPSLRRTNTPGGTFRSKLRIPANDGDEDGNYDSEESLPPLPNSEGTATTPGSSTHSPPTAPGPRADAAPPPPTDDYPPSDANV